MRLIDLLPRSGSKFSWTSRLSVSRSAASVPPATATILFCMLTWPAVARAQTWQPLQNQPVSTLGSVFLMTDGTLMFQDNGPKNNGSPNWWKLTPDGTGS